MWSTGQPATAGGGTRGQRSTQETLDRALVAGLILEVVLDQTDLPSSQQAQQRLVESRIQAYLVQHLAGQVSLDRFRRLARNLDGWFDFYYPLLVTENPKPVHSGSVTYTLREPHSAYTLREPRAPGLKVEAADAPALPKHQACLETLLDAWLVEAKTDIPQRPHRKLTPDKLKKFLCQSGGRWFRLRDLERFICMDRKTAWDYVQVFLQAGLLCHNRKNSAAVRYCLAPSFLKVEADALRLALSLCLALHPEALVEKISDFLIATGGEPFARQEWEAEFPGLICPDFLDKMIDQDILVWVELATGARFLKLQRRWLKAGSPKNGDGA